MVLDNTNKQKDGSNAVVSFGNIPRQIRSDDEADSRLTGFPTSLPYSQIADPETDNETAKFLLMMCAFDSGEPKARVLLRIPANLKTKLPRSLNKSTDH